jgi:hypothetical protein
MLRILFSVAAATVLALVSGSAVQADGHGHSSHSYGGHRTFYHQGHSYHSHYYERSYRGWSRYCWFPSYRCYGYYCPTQYCWYYWCGSQSCYLPVSYIRTFVPTPVNVNQNQNQNTNVNVNVVGGSGLPVGATPLAGVPQFPTGGPVPVGVAPVAASQVAQMPPAQ